MSLEDLERRITVAEKEVTLLKKYFAEKETRNSPIWKRNDGNILMDETSEKTEKIGKMRRKNPNDSDKD